MGCSIILVLGTLLLFLNVCNTDVTLNKFKILEISKIAPKVWHIYIRALIYRYHENDISHSLYTVEFLKVLEHVKYFKISKAKTVACSRRSPLEVTLKSLAGKFIFKTKCLSYVYVNTNGVPSAYHSATYQFYLHTLLRINLTFYLIDSQFASLVVQIKNTTWLGESYVFTGQYSSFIFYSKFNNILLDIVSHQNLHSLLFNGSFTVIDQNLICNVPVLIIKPDFMYQINAKYILSLYFLKVRKLDQITVVILYLNDSGCIKYDGPGILSRALKCQHIQICSTFQCVIHLLIQYFKTGKSYINYYSVPLQFTENIIIDEKQEFLIKLPNTKCLDSYCSLSIDALFGYQVNLTVVQIITSGLCDTSCTYCGLVHGEKLVDDYRQPNTLCDHQDGNTSPSRSYYSYNFSLIIVLYWYESYSTITVSVKMSHTKCQPVQIDICKYNEYCWVVDSIASKCIAYLNSVTQYSGVNISHGDHLSISQANEKCNVFVFLNSAPMKMNKRCVIRMRFDKSQVQSIQGVIQSFLAEHYIKYLDVCNKTYNLSTSCEVPRIKTLVFNKTLVNLQPKFFIVQIKMVTKPLSWFQIIVKHLNTLKLMAYMHDCIYSCKAYDPVLPGDSTVLILQISGYTRSNISAFQHFMIYLNIFLKSCK